MKKMMVLGAAVATCLSCASYGDGNSSKLKAMDAQVAAMSTCEKIKGLIAGHGNGFPALKMQKTNARLMDVWKARYNLVGDSCQVWSWGKGQTSYMCALSSPNRETAMEYYDKAKQVTAECVGAEWTLKEGARELGEGMKAQFSHAGTKTVVGVHAVSTPGLFKSEWTTYYFVGHPSDAL